MTTNKAVKMTHWTVSHTSRKIYIKIASGIWLEIAWDADYKFHQSGSVIIPNAKNPFFSFWLFLLAVHVFVAVLSYIDTYIKQQLFDDVLARVCACKSCFMLVFCHSFCLLFCKLSFFYRCCLLYVVDVVLLFLFHFDSFKSWNLFKWWWLIQNFCKFIRI